MADFGRFLSTNPAEFVKNAGLARALVHLLIGQTTQTECHVTQRAEAWCRGISVPYFRFNPLLGRKIPIDETNDADIIAALWEAKVFVRTTVKQEADLIIKILDGHPDK